MPFNCHPAILELSRLRFLESLAEANPIPAEETLLLFVGRGSRDPGANAELARFARLRYEQQPLGWHAACFTAMAKPLLVDALPRVVRLGFRRIVVQPHLLFQGELLARIGRQVATARSDHPAVDWLTISHLGPHELLVAAISATLVPS